MPELLRTNDPGLISVVEALLSEAGIPYQIADRNMSVLEGSINLIQARIKDIAQIQSSRDNQLVGYGLVIGLKGSGDGLATRRLPSNPCAPCWIGVSIYFPKTCKTFFVNLLYSQKALLWKMLKGYVGARTSMPP